MDVLRGKREQVVATGRKWQHEFLTVRDGKKADRRCTKAHTIWVCKEITLKGISGQRAMKWEIVQL